MPHDTDPRYPQHVTQRHTTYQRWVIATIQVEGFHNWEGAQPPFSYLSHRHRHLFHITVRQPVVQDREVEFITLGRAVASYIRNRWGHWPADFETMSCEAIAEAILHHFPHLSFCKVMEDRENGAIVTATREEQLDEGV